MTLKLVTDRPLQRGFVFPHLSATDVAPYTDQWRSLHTQWPWVTALRIQRYCELHQVPVVTVPIEHMGPEISLYPICLSFFDFSIDYLALLSRQVYAALVNKKLKLLFFYHEGDNPQRIKHKLDQLCKQHSVSDRSYIFVSNNSAADGLENFVAFYDSELWYYQQNHGTPPLPITSESKLYDFTVLVRMHRDWRAVIMSELSHQNILDQSLWSYCEPVEEIQTDQCAIEIDTERMQKIQRFGQKVPHFCDSLSQDQRNDHGSLVPDLYSKSWCHIVIESQFDVDQSHGVLLSEKTFKPIKHGQPFFILGAAGSLATLRQLGYRTFDHVFDNSYDQEHCATTRFHRAISSICQAQRTGLSELWHRARLDIEHNQWFFMQQKTQRLNTMIEKIYELRDQ